MKLHKQCEVSSIQPLYANKKYKSKNMVSLKIFSILLIVLFSIFAETYSLVRGFNEDDARALAEKFHRIRRSPHGHGVTGPVHTYVKTDKHANFKWGVRHHVGHKYAGN